MTKMNNLEPLPNQNRISHSIITCDSDRKIMSWNAPAEKVLGFTSKDALGQNLFDILKIQPKSLVQQKSLQEISTHQEENDPGDNPIIETIYHRDGYPIDVEILISKISENLFVVVFFDFVSKIKAEMTVQNAHQTQDVVNSILKISLEPYNLKTQLEHVLDYILSIKSLQLLPNAGIFLTNRKADTLLLVTERRFTRSPKAICQKIPFDFCYCGRAASTGKIQFVANVTEHHTLTHNHSKPHGVYCVPIIKETRILGVICLYTVFGHIQSDKEEELLATIANIIATIIDSRKINHQLAKSVSNLQLTVMELEEEKKFSESVIRGLNHGLIVADLDFVIINNNSMAQIILEPFCKTLHNKTIDDVFGIEAAEKIISSAGYRSSTTANLLQQDITLLTNDGVEKILNFSIVPREDLSSRQVGYIISFSDMTELTYIRKEMEKLNRLSTIAEIASAVAHEVRNPLAGIKIMAQSIQEEPENTEGLLECSRRIMNQVDRLNELLSEFFTYARPVTPKRTSTSIESILSETKPLIANKLRKNKIQLIEIFPDQTRSIRADPNQLQQVFLNLFLNSIDAIEKNGAITIEIGKPDQQLFQSYKRRYPTILQGSDYIQVLFSDNGSGIPAEETEKVFEPFFTTKRTGTGLGLSIVYRILTENKAAIHVESSTDIGTTFTMFFEMT